MSMTGATQSGILYVTSATELVAALQSATVGSTITLAPGDYGDVLINQQNFASEVTIKSADADEPATFNTIRIMHSSNLTLDGIEVAFKPTATTVLFDNAVSISGSSGVSVINSTIHGGPAVNGVLPTETDLDASRNVLGLPTARGINVVNSSDITIADNDISFFAKGVTLSSVDGLTIQSNEIHEMRTSLIAGGDVSNALIDANHLYHSNPWNFGGLGDHGDFIILWTTPTQDGPSENITITNNFIDQGTKSGILGIYLDDNANLKGHVNVTIDNNVISNANALGILLENVDGVVSNNTLIQPRDADYHTLPGILVKKGSQVELTDNVVGRITIYDDSTAKQTGNVIATREDYGKIFVNGLVYAPTLKDLVLAPGAEDFLKGAGADLTALALSDLGVRDADIPVFDTGPNGAFGTKPAEGGSAPIYVVKPIEIVTHLQGTVGADSLSDAKGAALLEAGAGDDKYVVNNLATSILEHETGGTDKVFSYIDYTLGNNLENLALLGTAKIGTGNELSNSIKANDLGNTIYGLGGDDTLIGGKGDDTLYGGLGNDRLTGGEGNDVLWGGEGNDVLNGDAGDDALYGGDGDDTLRGGSGVDSFTGGNGADKFIFLTRDLPDAKSTEWISDFSSAEKDKICLTDIDANILTTANDKFTFIGTQSFTHTAGELRYSVVDGDAIIQGDVNGDGLGDFTIGLAGVTEVVASNFML
jgi:Ca2+-binding RTX toxin-like protein